MINAVQIKKELETAINNRTDNKEKFNTDYNAGELNAFKKVLKRINQSTDENEICSICKSTIHVMPISVSIDSAVSKTGSNVESHWICKDCVIEDNIKVLPEYLENIEKFGHWSGQSSGNIA